MNIDQLEPKSVWRNFANLNAVPRASKKEEQVIAFMIDFGKQLGLETFSDEIGNVIIRKPATLGFENRKMVTLQSHLDMVHQKNTDTQFNFETQGIEMFIDQEWVKAKGTTLGADNGMGVAAIMALLESNTIEHPPLEALFTIDEETGMTGAFGLKGGVLKGEILLNLDTEEDDEIDIGCAGGIDVTATRNYNQKSSVHGDIGYQISVKGLKGGHSGMDIVKGLGNANKIMNRLLYVVLPYNMRIAYLEGGSLRNAIPRESTCILNIGKKPVGDFTAKFNEISKAIKNELLAQEPELEISLAEVKPAKMVMGLGAQGKLIKALYGATNGVYAMSATIEGLVETSNNIAKVMVKDGEILVGCLTRSSVDSAKLDLANSLRSVFELAGFEVAYSGSYPGWNPNPNSRILAIAKETYTNLFQHEPRVVACHAGLECGILGQNYPEIDMISFGPTILGAHSPDERVHIGSVQKFWKFLQEILRRTP
ncbi:aminoacyl-histidine dipeptidase [Maribacter confluentis]|uniref:Aminoacyl-histidine dipeptidase n=1 Tax=Maribacter confluentis TaxID=1656093 RepID=A0ABT8RUQ9_9FLAO|nr:aminoacyl-histidine dipeptidase [Maribacter confluentis]MDO1514227.1 aminoacyl-histidine dipeptidase [Maribacter confluentis]